MATGRMPASSARRTSARPMSVQSRLEEGVPPPTAIDLDEQPTFAVPARAGERIALVRESCRCIGALPIRSPWHQDALAKQPSNYDECRLLIESGK